VDDQGVGEPGRDRRVMRTASIWPINITVLFAYGAYFSFVTFLPAFLVVRLGLSQAEAGLVTSLITAGTIVSWPLAGLISDRLGRRKPVYLVSQVMSIAVCLAFAFVVPHLGLHGAMLIALASGFLVGGLILPFVMIVEMFPPELAGTAAGVTNAACFVGGMIFPIVLGYVADVTGGFVASFVLAAVLQSASTACALAVAETGHRRPLPA
jgi:nitrate/nitrite transporter NarK